MERRSGVGGRDRLTLGASRASARGLAVRFTPLLITPTGPPDLNEIGLRLFRAARGSREAGLTLAGNVLGWFCANNHRRLGTFNHARSDLGGRRLVSGLAGEIDKRR